MFDSAIEEPTALLAHLTASLDFSASGHYRSTFPSGNPLMLDALSRRYGAEADRILATAGASAGVQIVCAALLGPGARVLVERPYFEMLVDLARSVGAEVDHLDRDPSTGAITPDALDAAIGPETRLVLLTNPNNPTGFVLDREARRALAAVAQARRVPVLFDEVYAGFTEAAPPHTLAAHDSPWFVSVGSLSKLYGLHALKCGWIVAGTAVHDRVAQAYRRLENGASRLTHAIGARVLEAPEPFDAHWRGVLATSRPLVETRLAALEDAGLIRAQLPASGCIAFPRLPDGWCDAAFSAFVWSTQALAAAPGNLFGRPGHLRIGFGREAADVAEGLDRLEAGLRAFGTQPR
ncbi:pyridoxal phosphate-dependent aminotransferase [Luteimonas sp. FCS-9]|uniref:pyridoxal phosphate-dependent aminotransferase n=1 Tax=Luteimonas sp. FCS-9 TaxID=1547516 RepID=UPI0018CD2DCB|nr:pyridoxal phosphate-dependent aminotransferase [Luteimonas sp. FCS-9]